MVAGRVLPGEGVGVGYKAWVPRFPIYPTENQALTAHNSNRLSCIKVGGGTSGYQYLAFLKKKLPQTSYVRDNCLTFAT